MNKNINDLIKKFNEISNKKWIRSVNNSLGSIGITFENELGKKSDSMYFPDYNGIELKCTGRYSRYPIFLFTISFDGPTFPEINRIVEKYGWADVDFPEKKVLFTKLSCIDKTVVNSKFKMSLEIDYNEEKLYLCVYDFDDKLIERKSYVYLDSIKSHFELKLNVLALIKASKRIENNQKYFRYYEMSIYTLKSFNVFLKLIEKGKIEINLISRIAKSGNDIGRYRNKNLVFEIKKDNISLLFDEIEHINHDTDNIGFNIL